ncbi:MULTISPECIES: 2-(1,2-epoxy-1,2-dihydrophenyl)acetyl-CoA isomerase PaaG [unclassified Chelatococcus]|uniref:2-(1,2-epoxy-1,2-dihydrophenyl)acetyl-CoA isomerase PaaG n=1 Tax=unclassified Chelatococcus TaxID=2638111 RepID=UPI001BCEDC7B|nr:MULTISPECIES: 2-(1,2-epoxy-1,2-dihydrophenyl)acetyl-CoA isomerase PaaG [unclassified Chelatococcus]MBS7699676.1 2-(1,2-epoxy-1,2-dihydrophenyl)acetyl-CoA isomerase PaaG [Chelatococcus sp. YT9]MBX3557126.1 2-(1,2-epoxy-1,2-dihydrophenyl)acetyl-CoA isomerase PaaG [Chelatococcus sp.]
MGKGEGYRILTLNRPSRLNAFNVAMHEALRTALDEAEADDECKALILTGAGRGFCTGQDLADRIPPDGTVPDLGDSLERYYNPLVRRLRAFRCPVIAAVNGVAAGAGANIALACDIVIAARSARFLELFTNLGLVPDCGGTWILPRLIGPARATATMLLATPVSAEQAAAWGLVWKICEDEDLATEARAIAALLARKPSLGITLTKQALGAAGTNSLSAQLDLERDLQRQAGLEPGYVERVKAFLAKR